MAIMKEALAIVLAAGIVTTGVMAYLPRVLTQPSAEISAAEPAHVPGGRASESELVQAKSLLRDAFAAASRNSPAETATPPKEAPAQPVESPPGNASASAAGTVLGERVEARLETPAALPSGQDASGGAWSSKPQPDLMAKAELSFDNGDVAGARSWLEAALEAGDAEAAFRLAETYDPAVLAEWRIIGIGSDTAKARMLYEQALNGGVEAARIRVARLTP